MLQQKKFFRNHNDQITLIQRVKKTRVGGFEKLFARCSVFLSRIKDKIWLIPSLQLYFQSERERF